MRIFFKITLAVILYTQFSNQFGVIHIANYSPWPETMFLLNGLGKKIGVITLQPRQAVSFEKSDHYILARTATIHRQIKILLYPQDCNPGEFKPDLIIKDMPSTRIALSRKSGLNLAEIESYSKKIILNEPLAASFHGNFIVKALSNSFQDETRLPIAYYVELSKALRPCPK
jgi:hypothetical protein